MNTCSIQTLGNPGSFDITDKDNPLYYIARYSHECSKQLYELDDAGFELFHIESSDITTFRGIYQTYFTAISSWVESAVAASEAGGAIPALPSPVVIPALPDAAMYPAIIINALIRVALIWLRQKLDSDTDASEISQVLKRAFLDEDGAGDEYALIKQMANIPLEIVISKADGFEDISYADRPET